MGVSIFGCFLWEVKDVMFMCGWDGDWRIHWRKVSVTESWTVTYLTLMYATFNHAHTGESQTALLYDILITCIVLLARISKSSRFYAPWYMSLLIKITFLYSIFIWIHLPANKVTCHPLVRQSKSTHRQKFLDWLMQWSFSPKG